MTYADSNLRWDKIHQKDERTGFIVSLVLHVLLFLTAGAVFVKTAAYSVQSIPESIQVDLVQAPVELKTIVEPPKPKPIEKPVENIFAQPVPRPKLEKKQVIKSPTKAVASTVRVTEARPNYIQNPPPPYPELAKQMHQEGLVLLSVDVDRQGDPLDVRIIQSCGHRMLDEAALKAVQHWKFQPGRIGDLPIGSRVTVPIRFRLEDGK